MFHKSTGVIYPTNNMTEPLTESLPEFLDIANEIYENNWCQSIVNFTFQFQLFMGLSILSIKNCRRFERKLNQLLTC